MRQLLPIVVATLALGACDTKEGGGTSGNAQMLDDSSMTGKSCELVGETMSCGEGGVAFCDDFAGDLEWGPCIDETTVECTPEEASGGCSTCVLYGGIPYWDQSDCGGDTPLVLR
jgi:hypothetical protein